MPRKIIPLRPQKQVDQAIKNFILDKSHRETRVNLCLGGGTAISLKIFRKLCKMLDSSQWPLET